MSLSPLFSPFALSGKPILYMSRDFPNKLQGCRTVLTGDWDLATLCCKDGIKLRVFIEDREVIPVILDDISSLDLSTNDTVKDLETFITDINITTIFR